jgi:glycosyltransferase involved in cell wall biosynthesis
MNSKPYISICIPAYQRVDFLKRLLDSIAAQTFSDFEVIITDDSRSNIIEEFIKGSNYLFALNYIYNHPAKGTPLNWLEGIKHANGEWIKIMHDDDWFANPGSLKEYADNASDGVDCVFSGYQAYFEETKKIIDKTILQRVFKKINNHPFYLFASNKIGPPSVLMFRKNMNELYDPEFKWLVDLEGYIRMMKKYNCIYIDKPLITMSYNDTQVTNDCFGNPDVEIKESLQYFKKFGSITFSRPITYDAWWRMLRNLNISKEQDLMRYSHGIQIPFFLIYIVRFQSKIPQPILKTGVFSKIFMIISFLMYKLRGFSNNY